MTNSINAQKSRAGHRRLAALSSTCLAALVYLGPTIADAADNGSYTLEEVVVTARKRDESIQNIPVAVTAVSARKLDDYGLRDIESIARSTPQLSVVRGNNGSGATISVRGIGSTYTSIGIEQSVAVNLDGVYYGQGRIINEGFFDMKQVEILRGPQALFFGKNATAGVLSFRSADPGSSFEATARAGYEFEAKTANVEAVVSGPVSDTFGLRLAVRYSGMSGGYVENVAPATTLTTFDIATGTPTVHAVPAPQRDVPAERDFSARLTAKYTPSDQFSLTLKGSVTRYRIDNATWNSEIISCPSGETQKHPGETCAPDRRIEQNNVPVEIARTNPLLGRHGGQLYQDYDAYAWSANAAYTGEKLDITSVSGLHRFVNYFLGDYDLTGSADGGTWGAERSKYKAFSEEIRAQSKLDGPINVMAGVYYQNTRLDFDQQIIFPGALEDSSVSDPTKRYLTAAKLSYTDGTTFAGFGQLQWKLIPTLELDAGARYTHETKDSQFVQPYIIAPYQGVFRQNHPLVANQTFDNLSPEVTLTWTPSADWTVFGAFKQGYKSGGFSGSAIDSAIGNTTVGDLAFNPEKARGFEGGVRAFLLDHTLRLALDVYNYEYTDLQIDFFDPNAIMYITENAASARVKGIEFEGEWAPPVVRGLTLRGSLAYNKARYEDFHNAPCWAGQRPIEGCTINPTTGRAVQDLSGQQTGLAPDWTGSLEANYEHHLTEGLILGAGANVRYSSDYLANPFGNPGALQDAYATLDATLRLRTADGRWEAAVIGKNLTDEYVAYSISDVPTTGGGTGTPAGFRSDNYAVPNLPRTIAVQLTWKY